MSDFVQLFESVIQELLQYRKPVYCINTTTSGRIPQLVDW